MPIKFKTNKWLHWQKPLFNPEPNITKIIGILSAVLIILILFK